MPEVAFTLRWPDGSTQRCMSPSRTIESALAAGASYPVEELVRRCREALEEGSERVRERYGYACSMASSVLEDIEARAARAAPGARVAVERVSRAPVRRRFAAPERVDGHRDVVVVGGGQAGLSVSFELAARGIAHLVLERDRVACSWRDQRWDAFCLVTPNDQCVLPGHPYAGDDPQGFMLRDEIVAYVESFAASFGPPLMEGVTVTEVRPDGDGFVVETSHGTLTCGHVVLAVGGYHRPVRPRLAERVPGDVFAVHSSAYRNPSSLPDGAVLVVGTGQSGAQIAEDLFLAGREVHLSVGTAPRVARSYRGRDCMTWLREIGRYDLPVTEHPDGENTARHEANHYVTGRGGGHDLDLRAFARDGMRLHGRLLDVGSGEAVFGSDLVENLDNADARMERIKDTIDEWIAERGLDAPAEDRYEPVWTPDGNGSGRVALRDAGITSIVWATGFSADWSWVRAAAFDGTGYPVHHRGVTSVDGLSVIGLPWLHTWGSGRFLGVARDAAHIAEHAAARVGRAAAAA